jgi:hypothetical protein
MPMAADLRGRTYRHAQGWDAVENRVFDVASQCDLSYSADIRCERLHQ